jgi:predicted  nucleic acid-binding Zn-ribbon protein
MIDSPRCIKCEHYYITWDKSFPYGCKAMGFKSYRVPSIDVRAASGKECLAFTRKITKDNS